MKQDFKTLTDREHILLRPQMYIGAVDLTKTQEYILENGKIELKDVQYVPGLIKIINEVLDNSVDVAIKTNFEHSNKIDVKIDKKSITVKDNGTGIPVKKMENGKYIPFMAWNSAKSGSNFSDDENRTQIGMNGVGSYQTNCFSKKFTGKTDDGNKAYEVTFKNNAQEFKETLKESKAQGTEVKFFPDLERFGLKEIDETHVKIIEQRLINLSMSFPEITFKLNGKRVISGSFKKFAEMFGDSPTILETEKYRYAFLYNPEDDFRHFSYVNGLKIPEGGTHIEAVTEPIVQFMREKLQRRFKGIKPQDIRNKLLVLAFLKDLPNPKFNSQTKEKITNSRGDINAYLGDLDFEKLGNQIHRNKQILEGITEIFKIKEEFKKRQEMKSLQKPKKIKSDKYIPAIKKRKYLLIQEGECLDENTLVMMSDFSSRMIKDVSIGDSVMGQDYTPREVLGQAKLLKETITIKTQNTEITMGKSHKIKVFDTVAQDFVFVRALKIQEEPSRYKILRSKINNETIGAEVLDIQDYKIILEHGEISFTDDDNFIVLRDETIQRIHSSEVKVSDLVILS